MSQILRSVVIVVGAAATSGCAGLDIVPITKQQAQTAHDGSGKAGYIVYHPLLLVRVGSELRCPQDKMPDGKCDRNNATIEYCEVSAPFLFPDYERPYRVTSKAGLGKAGVEVSIMNGWMLSSFKDNSDNTALLSELSKGLMKKFDGKSPTCPTGIYQWTEGGFLRFDKFGSRP